MTGTRRDRPPPGKGERGQETEAEVPETFQVDLTNCDREPIHLLGAIQPFGFLLAVSPDWVVQRVSANCEDWLGRPAEQLLGRPANEVLSGEAIHALRNRLQYLRGANAVEPLFNVGIAAGRPPLDLSVHLSGGTIVIEGEPAHDTGLASASGSVRAMIGRLQATNGLDQLLRDAARLLQALTGYDRVMVYRFDDNGSGKVVAESLRGGMPSFLGQHFPAADIPQQARRLYLRNWLRLIADAAAEPVPVVPARDAQGAPLDLSMSGLRSVSPIHLEYLSNMGVRGSMSVSVIVGGRLWGLLACHHREPLILPLETRTAAELFGQVFSLLVESGERKEEVAYDERARSLHLRLMGSLASAATTAQNIAAYLDEMQQVLACHGVGIWAEGEATLKGVTPTPEQFEALADFLTRTAGSELYATDRLSEVYPEAESLLPEIAGLLAVPISRAPRDYLVLFRREVAGEVTWAGDPAKAVTPGPSGPRLTPRRSFELWQEVVRGQSEPWSSADRHFAEALRVTILEVMLSLGEVVSRDREQARQKQDLLIAELNHRVRNILALMRAIVGQSRPGFDNVDEFAEVLGDRIQALARAHDQITRDNWGPASFRGLVEAEVAAYLLRQPERVQLQGPELLIRPQAFSTLALVFHELMTNAGKYGALSNGEGSVAVAWRLEGEEGDMVVEWSESHGPPVTLPDHRGFGSTIIERSVPYDLHGRAEIEFRPEGLRANFMVPAQHVVPAPLEDPMAREEAWSGTPAPYRRSAGHALIVEDNMILAIETEDLLRETGFSTAESVPSVSAAYDRIGIEKPDFAVLDVNLGQETSFAVADRLAELGIPFVFATGYGDQAVLPAAHKHRPLLAKPLDGQLLRRVLDGLEAGAADLPNPEAR